LTVELSIKDNPTFQKSFAVPESDWLFCFSSVQKKFPETPVQAVLFVQSKKQFFHFATPSHLLSIQNTRYSLTLYTCCFNIINIYFLFIYHLLHPVTRFPNFLLFLIILYTINSNNHLLFLLFGTNVPHEK